jgi:hypothetical protein
LLEQMNAVGEPHLEAVLNRYSGHRRGLLVPTIGRITSAQLRRTGAVE